MQLNKEQKAAVRVPHSTAQNRFKGYSASLNGWNRSDCGYPQGSSREEWLSGYDDAASGKPFNAR